MKRTTKGLLTIDLLELRRHFAGNVTAGVIGGVLIVRGDKLANSVVVEDAQPGAGQITIRSPDGATTINGNPNASFSGATRGISAELGEG